MGAKAKRQNSSALDPKVQREIIRLALNEIAAEVGSALRDAHLDHRVYLTVPNSGESFATVATPADPSNEEWSKISAIVCTVIGARLGGIRLCGHSLPCAMVDTTVMGAVEVTPEECTPPRAMVDAADAATDSASIE